MPKAEVMHTPSRRKFLGHIAGGAAVAAVASTAASAGAISGPILAAHNPDAELIALCDRIVAVEQEHAELCELMDGAPEHAWVDQASWDCCQEADELAESAAEFLPSTPAGYAALVAAIVATDPLIVDQEVNPGTTTLMLAALFQSLTAGGVS